MAWFDADVAQAQAESDLAAIRSGLQSLPGDIASSLAKLLSPSLLSPAAGGSLQGMPNMPVTVTAPFDARRLLLLAVETSLNTGQIQVYGQDIGFAVAAGKTVQQVIPTGGRVFTILKDVKVTSDTYSFLGDLTIQGYLDGKPLVGPYETSSSDISGEINVSFGQYLFGLSNLTLSVTNNTANLVNIDVYAEVVSMTTTFFQNEFLPILDHYGFKTLVP